MKELRCAIRTEFSLEAPPASLYLPGPSIQVLDLSFESELHVIKTEQINDFFHLSVGFV